ncbi:SAV_6107 family HEPN domain-containing protein [Streptomyces sp.]|uniref:SAV_6107 family HEPN domain-containing protein n=1 Tax=Streptomyces sp. TaxID=1931 RepID=UPI0025E21CF8|nr:SAV_6107 family HEPN domain-containing protein [Streptomyces sp.]
MRAPSLRRQEVRHGQLVSVRRPPAPRLRPCPLTDRPGERCAPRAPPGHGPARRPRPAHPGPRRPGRGRTARHPQRELRDRPPGRPAHRSRGARRRAWEVLPEVAPELTEWSALFASGAARRARAEAGIQGAAGRRDADDLIRDVAMFLRIAERMLVLQPVLPQPRRQDGERPAGDPGRELPDAG